VITVVEITKEEWRNLAEDAHKAVFGETRPQSMDRIDYALLAVDANGDPVMYQTIIEIDAESAYWQLGGPFEFSPKTFLAASQAYKGFIEWSRARYRRATTRIANTHVSYLKFAMDCGFRIVGVRILDGEIFCELLMDFKEN
jgi:hypothetical protein